MRHHPDSRCRVAAMVVTVSLPPAPAKPPPPPIDQSPLDHLKSDRIHDQFGVPASQRGAVSTSRSVRGAAHDGQRYQRRLLGALPPRDRHARSERMSCAKSKGGDRK